MDLHELATVFLDNHMPSVVLKNREKVLTYLREKTVDESTIAVGGSTALFQFGIIDELRSRNLNFFGRYARYRRRRKSRTCFINHSMRMPTSHRRIP